ncbi:MAG: NfeD family protein [Acetobacteraceae bacterium]|nr:NfeD family protein [Acetobacteraceae bacterium]
MEPGLIWILAGLLLLVAELALPGIMLFWTGLAALGNGIVLLLVHLDFGDSLLVFGAFFVASIAVGLQFERSTPATSLNTPESGLVGRSGTLLPNEGPGLRVRIGDSDWPARLPRDVRVPEGPVPVRVESVDGTTLVVRPE